MRRRPTPQQLDLFARPSDVEAVALHWRMSPEEVRVTLTKLMVRLILDHAAGAQAPLRRQLVAMGQDAGLGAVTDHLAGDRREHDGLARTGGRHAQRVAAGGERSHAALDEGFWRGRRRMAGLPLTAPSSADRRRRGRTRAGWAGWPWWATAGRGPAPGRR